MRYEYMKYVNLKKKKFYQFFYMLSLITIYKCLCRNKTLYMVIIENLRYLFIESRMTDNIYRIEIFVKLNHFN